MPYPPAKYKPPAVPLFKALGNRLEFWGTGTLVHYRNSHLLISCAHCFDQDGEHTIFVGGNLGFPIARPVLVTSLPDGLSRCHDPVDFAVVALRQDEVTNLSHRLSFIPETAIEGSISNDQPNDFGVFGFPARDNNVDMTTGTLSANAIELPARKDIKFRDSRIRRNPTWYLPLHFDPRQLERVIQSDFTIPRPDGMSGGPIFRYDRRQERSLAGIVIEHHVRRKVLLGLRSIVIRDLLNGWWQRIIDAS